MALITSMLCIHTTIQKFVVWKIIIFFFKEISYTNAISFIRILRGG